MLDALKALFILTGASTYLVTKYVNISQQQQQHQQPEQPGWTTGGNRHQQQQQHHHHQHQQHHQHQHPSLQVPYSHQQGPAADQQLAWPSGGGGQSMRPIYVLAVEEEGEPRDMPKSLLNLSISDEDMGDHQQHRPPFSTADIEYILDAKMDDYADVMKHFALNRSTGQLLLTVPLDRDPPNGRARWRFSIQARSRTTQMVLAVADVAITVRDINDNKPLFEQQLYRVVLMENGPAGQVLTKLHAVDFDEADTSDNGKILYSLVKPVPASTAATGSTKSITELFQIDPHTGLLTVLDCCFDREKRSEYRLTARATDAGGLWDDTRIVVDIGDLNDNPPKFINPDRILRLSNDQEDVADASGGGDTEDENIFTFYISDEDLPETNRHQFDLANVTECSLFNRFYIVINADGSGTLYGHRRNHTELEDFYAKMPDEDLAQEQSCHLQVAVRDTVRDSVTSAGLQYEDRTTLTLVFHRRHPNRKWSKAITDHVAAVNGNSSAANAMAATPDHHLDGDPTAYDRSATGNRDAGDSVAGVVAPPATDSTGSTTTAISTTESLIGAFQRWFTVAGNDFLFYATVIVLLNLIVLIIAGSVWAVKRTAASLLARSGAPPPLHEPELVQPDLVLATTTSATGSLPYYQIPHALPQRPLLVPTTNSPLDGVSGFAGQGTDDGVHPPILIADCYHQLAASRDDYQRHHSMHHHHRKIG